MKISWPSTRVDIDFHLPRLFNADVLEVVHAWRHLRPIAPRFFEWLLSGMMDETIRRASELATVPRRPKVMTIDFDDWSSKDLAEALLVANQICYMEQTHDLAEFFDAVAVAINQAAALRLSESNAAI